MLANVSITGFRGLVEADLPLSPGVTLVLGDNEAGKTSTAQAILFALCGFCKWTDARGAGYSALIRHGEKAAAIAIAIDEVGEAVRTITHKGITLSVDGTPGDAAKAMLEASLPTRDVLACCLTTPRFIGLPRKEQQAVLFALAGGAADAAWFRSQLGAEEQEVLANTLSSDATGATLSDALYKTAYDTRAEANKRLKSEAAKLEAIPVVKPSGADAQTIADHLAEARTVFDQANQALGAAQATATAREASARRLTTAMQNLSAAQATLDAMGDRPECPGDAAIANLYVQEQGLLALFALSRQDLAERTADVESAKRYVSAVASLGGKCIATHTVSCPLTGDALDAIKQAAESMQQDAEKSLREAQVDFSEKQERVDKATTKRNEANGQAAAASQWDARHAVAVAARDEAQKAIDAANEESEEPPGPDAAALQQARDEAATEVTRLEARLQEVRDAERSQADRQKLAASVRTLQARADVLDALVKLLSPDGLPAKAMAETVGKVLDDVNAALAEFTDFTLEFGDELTVLRHDVRTAVVQLCESEQLRVGSAIQVAFARVSGFGFVVVDEADRLNAVNRVGLLRMLLGSGVQALVLATPMDDHRPTADGLTVYELHNGMAVEYVAEASMDDDGGTGTFSHATEPALS